MTLATLALRLPELDRYATIDESRWVARAADFASYLQQGDLDNTFIVGHPGVTTMWLGAIGLGPERVQAFSYLEGQTDVTRREGYLEALVAARQPAVVANALALGALVWIAWALLGPGPALIGGLLLLVDPFLGAHSRLIHLDALLSSFMALAALAGVAFWSGRSWAYLVVAGLASGLAFLTKAPSVYLLAFLPALALFTTLRTGRGRARAAWARLVAGLALWAGLAGLVCLALWPALRLKPLLVPGQMLEFAARNSGSERDNFFLGQPVEDPGFLFYPLALLFRATPLLLLGLALLAYALARHRQQLAAFRPALLLGAYATGFLLMMSFGQKKFDRYELPVFPILDLLAGLGLWWALSRSLAPALSRSRALPLSRSLAPALAVLALAIWPLAAVYPYYLAYYNPLLGGGAVAQRALFVGWGEGIDQVAAYLNARPIVLQAPSAATAYHRVLQAHLHGNNAMPLERAELADYIVLYVNSIQRDQKADLLAAYLAGQEPEHVVRINGIEYARVYRGPHLPLEQTIGADFGGRVRLEGAVFAPGSARARAGDDLLLRLRWRPLGEVEPLVGVVRLVGPDGRTALQARHPFAQALPEAGLLLLDLQLRLPANLRPADYRLAVLVEDAAGRAIALPSGGSAITLQQVVVQAAVAR